MAERLEDRRVLAVTAEVLGLDNHVVFQGDESTDTVHFSVVDGYLQHNLGNLANFASNRDLDSTMPGEQALLLSDIGSLTFNDSGANDRIFFGGSEAFDLDEAALVLSVGEITISPGVNISTTSGAIDLLAAETILVSTGSVLSTVDGGIALTANRDASTSSANRAYFGLHLDGATLSTSGAGSILLEGTGIHSGTNFSAGVGIEGGTTIVSTSEDADAGTIEISGFGADGSELKHGVVARDAGNLIQSEYGDIRIEGVGGSRSDGGGANFWGVYLAGLDIRSTGIGPDAAEISIDGVGGAETSGNDGVRMLTSNVSLSSIDGDITIAGRSGAAPSTSGQRGVFIQNVSHIRSTGTGPGAANIRITGTVGTATALQTSASDSYGVELTGSSTEVSTIDGDIVISGSGGDGGILRHGLNIAANVSSTGVGADAGNITLDGQAGTTGHGWGAMIAGTWATVDGDISITGQGTSTDQGAGAGLRISGLGSLMSSGTGTDAGRITLSGVGGSIASRGGTGVTFSGTNGMIGSVDGDIQIVGTAGAGNSSSNVGILVTGSTAGIASTGTANITLAGKGAAGTSSNVGILIEGLTSGISSTDGDIAIVGRAGAGSGSGNTGLSLANFGIIESKGAGASAGKILISGTGATGSSGNVGVLMSGSSASTIRSQDGDIHFVGTGGNWNEVASSSINGGIVVTGVGVESTGTTGDAATVTFEGHAGVSTTSVRAVELVDSTVSSEVGDIRLLGSPAFGNAGSVSLLRTDIESSGTSPLAANIFFSGSGVSVSGNVNSVDGEISFLGLSGTGAFVSGNVNTVNGDVSLVGLGGSSASGSGTITSTGTGRITFDGGTVNYNGTIRSESGDMTFRGSSIAVGNIESTGTDENAARILIGDDSAHSISINGNVSSVSGDIDIKNNITDAATGVGYVWIYGNITSTGTNPANAAKITIDGTGAKNQSGVYLRGNNQVISSVMGDITITGRGGDSSSTSPSITPRGVWLQSITKILSTGTDANAARITIHGTGGAGVNNGAGVYFDGNSAGEISSAIGAISITGVGGNGTGRDNAGVYVRNALIASTGTTIADPALSAATITINGTGGSGTTSNHGVWLDPNALISSTDGAVSIYGTGGSSSNTGGSSSNGVYLNSLSSIVSSGTGDSAATITVDGTAGLGTNGSGVFLRSTTISSDEGAIAVTGRGVAGRTIGLSIEGATIITSTGVGENAATIDLIGIGGNGTGLNDGIKISRSTTSITSIDGDITMDGTAGNTGNSSGTWIEGSATIASLGTTPAAAKISILGSTGEVGLYGIFLLASGLITSEFGDIFIRGEANSIGIWNGSGTTGALKIQSTGLGADAAQIRIEGTGSSGVALGAGNGNEITTIDGDISITGSGRGSGSQAELPITSTGTGPSAGNITIIGTGDLSLGTRIGAPITTTDGDLTIIGTAGDGSSSSHGVQIRNTVSSIGTGVSAGRITISGTTASVGANGVHLDDGSGTTTGSAVASLDGDITITGTTGGGTGSGVFLRQGVTSTGADKDHAAQIRIDGAGGPNGGLGIQLFPGNETNPNISTVAGDVLLTGTGGSGGGSGNRGIWLRSAYVASTGATTASAGKITLEGTGGSGGTSGLVGVDLDNSMSNLVSVAGDIEIIATAGVGSGTNNSGLRLAGSSLIGNANTTANITIRTDSINLLSGAIQSTGNLMIEPKSSGTTIGLGGGVGDLNLDDAELAMLVDGFAMITIGNSNAGAIDINTATFTDDVMISGASISDHAGIDIDAGSNRVTLVGTVAPGQSPGVLNVSADLELADGAVLSIEINGPTAGETANDHDQVNVVGTITIGANVQLLASSTNGFEPTLGQQLVIINNDGTDPIVGTFSGLPEGAILTGFLGANLDAQISYRGPDGSTGNDVVLTIIEGNQAPTADAGGPYSIEEGDSLVLDASGSSDPDNDTLSYVWDLNGDGDFSDANGATPIITWAELVALGLGDDTEFTVTVSVDDGRATPVTASATVNVTLNQPPTADAGGPYWVNEGSTVTLDASGTTDDKGLANLFITWDLDGDGVFGETGADAERGDEVGLNPIFSAATVSGFQNFTVRLRVQDAQGRVDFDSTTVSVGNVAPTIDLASSITAQRGTTFTLTGSFTDPGPDNWTATVNYGDGSGVQSLLLDGKSFQLSHAYSKAGFYTAVVTVDDGDGGVTSKNLTVNVQLPPLADLTLISSDVLFDPINPKVGDPVNFEIKVRNDGTLAAATVPVSVQVFDADTETFREIRRGTIDSIDAKPINGKSERQINLTWDGSGSQLALPTEDAYLLVRVVIDPYETIEELDESNNEAIQVLQVGSPDFGSATLAGDVANFSTTRGTLTPVGGQVYYDFSTIPGTNDFPVQNASVIARLIDQQTGEVLRVSGASTAPNGNFLHVIRAPEVDGVYTLTFEVNEGTLHKVFETTLTVDGDPVFKPPRPRGPAGPGYVFSPSIELSHPALPPENPQPDEPRNPQIGEAVTIYGTFDYERAEPLLNVPVTFNNLFPVAGQLRKFEIGSGSISFPEGGLAEPTVLPMQWIPTAEGYHILQVIAEPDFKFQARTHVTQLVLVGDLDTTSLNVDYDATIVPDTPPAGAKRGSFGGSAARGFSSPRSTKNSDTPEPGDTLLFTLRYENTGTTTITGGLLIDDFDERLLGIPTNISDGGQVVDGQIIRWELPDIAPGDFGTVSYEITVNSSAEFPPGSAFVLNTAILNANQAVAASTNELTIRNNAPVITDLIVSSFLDENGNVTLMGSFSDASENDTHTVQIDWGNGQSDTLTYNEGERSFSIGHSYGLIHAPLIDSYTINVSVTDNSGQSSSDLVTTLVPVVDQASPSSSVTNAIFDSDSGLYDMEVTFADIVGTNGANASGVKHVDIYYRVNPQGGSSLTRWFGQAVLMPASQSGTKTLSGSFDAMPGDVIQLWSVATDAAGNVENEVTPRTDFSFVIADTVGPETQVVSAIFDGSAFIDLTISGADVGGGNIDRIEVYVETNPGTAGNTMNLVGTVNGGSTVVQGQLRFAVPQDGVARSYRFFSIGVDHLGNREGGSGTFDGDPGPDADILLTDIVLAEPTSVQITNFDVNNGLENRSSIHSVDVLFNDENFIDDILASLSDDDPTNDRIRLERLDLAGNPIGAGEFLSISAVRDGLSLRLDFGPLGLQQNGVYAIRVDMDGDTSNGFEELRRFHRLQGDVNGDGVVDTRDLLKARQAFRNPALHADADVDGDGRVDNFDLRFFPGFLQQSDVEKKLLMSRDNLDD